MSEDKAASDLKWYVAHVILYLEYMSEAPEQITVWENMYLIHAGSRPAAMARARELGAFEEESDRDSGHTADGHPVRWRFGGIRKLTECILNENTPQDGDELTYIEYTIPDVSAINDLLENKPAVVTIE